MPIELIERKNLSTRICSMLQEYILNNDLSPGDKLPSEIELVRGFGVSRGVVREALRALEILGIVEAKAGEGTFIKEFSSQPLLMQMIFNASLHATKLEDLAEIRFILEKGVVELVIERATIKDLQILGEIVKKIDGLLANEPKGDLEEISKLDLEFHHSLIRCVKNSILAQFAFLWVSFFHQIALIKDTIPMSDYYNYAAMHGRLLEAIESRNVNVSLDWVREHLKFWLEGEFRAKKELYATTLIMQDKSPKEG
jgi:GntR family transcriptional repressor for pyruvate dehydrogenase complex